MGHLARCLSLAAAWKARGGDVSLVSDLPPRMWSSLGVPDLEVAFVPSVHPHPDDLRTTLAALQSAHALGRGVPWLMLDGYHFDSGYHEAIRRAGYCLLVVDDTAHRGEYAPDVLLNQNAGAEELTYRMPEHVVRLLGTEYVLLRDEFAPYAEFRRSHRARATRVLVTMGGADLPNMTGRVLAALRAAPTAGITACVVVGGANPRAAELVSEAAELGAIVVQNARDMAARMAWADLAISAAGSTCWEMAYMQLPALLVATADNQVAVAERLGRLKVATHLGWHEAVTEANLAEAIAGLASDRPGREEMARNGRRLVDGRGTERVMRALLFQEEPVGGVYDERGAREQP